MLEKRHSSEGGADCSFFVSASLAGNFWDEVWWTVGAHLSELTGEGLWEDDTVTMKGFRQTVQDWIEIAGYQNYLQVRETSDKPFWSTEIHAVKGAIPTDGPFMGFSGTANCGLFTNVPGTESRTISSLDSCGVNRIQSDMAVSFFEAAIFHVFGEDPAPESITYKPKNDDIPAFREWAVPVFGTPWLQCLGSFANDTANPDNITDDIPDWSLYVVGYFKLVGNRRCLILQKEPGGWRLLLTGKTITNPERHQFLREEIARMAGMTSETLWEPQAVGEGWLGVPG